MERLTKRIDGSVVFPNELIGKTVLPDNTIMHGILHRLADYEDAEQDGRMVVLPPVKIGDTAFFIINNHIFGGEVYLVSWEHHKSFGIRGYISADCVVGAVSANLFDFGKTVFLTYKEAEAALKGGAE